MQVYLIDAFDTQWSKRAQSHMQRYARDLHPASSDQIQHMRREVQACGGSSYGTSFSREDSLIAFAVSSGIVAVDVGRQRHMTDLLQDAEEIIDRGEFEKPVPVLAALQNFRLQYDRSVSVTPGQPWRSEAPDGGIGLSSDVLAMLAQVGDSCS